MKPVTEKNSKLFYLGLDFGTSACKAILIDRDQNVVFEAAESYAEPVRRDHSSRQDPLLWSAALITVASHLSRVIDPAQIDSIAVAGTAATILACSRDGEPLSKAYMYDDQSCQNEQSIIEEFADRQHIASSASSSLAKMLHLTRSYPDSDFQLHQTDWISGLLCQQFGFSDINNSLKAGYDVVNERWPDWIGQLPFNANASCPPCETKVFMPGTPVGKLRLRQLLDMGFSPDTDIVAGTTDSTAATLATGACEPGDAVTSLGSTLVVKTISPSPVSDAATGVYSHRFGQRWLAGGASNSGAAILKQFFTIEQIDTLSKRIDTDTVTDLNYYPLPGKGERFPVNDPEKLPVLEPRPESDVLFLQGLLEGITAIEIMGYQKLVEAGASKPTRVFSAGGGANNPAWNRIRQQMFARHFPDAVFCQPRHQQAAFGCALLALRKTIDS